MSSRLDRVVLRYERGHPGPASVVVKIIEPDWPEDPHGQARERRFYVQLLPKLGLPHPHLYHVGRDAQAGASHIVMEDLGGRYAFPSPTHRWTEDEMRCLLQSYARLHVRGRDCLPGPDQRGWLLPPYEKLISNDAIPSMAAQLSERGFWGELPQIDALLERTRGAVDQLAGYPVTLLHNDAYPPNVALPGNLEDDAIIIDWGMLSWGWAEMDLAYLFMQPFRASEHIDRKQALRYYWRQREALEDPSIPFTRRLEIQRCADAALALALIIVAHRRALNPLPPDSPGRTYWKSMYNVLFERLHQLGSETW